MSLYDLIFEFFITHVFYCSASAPNMSFLLDDMSFTIGQGDYAFTLSFDQYLAHTASIISITIIVVLCCLFVYKIIKLIGGLIR